MTSLETSNNCDGCTTMMSPPLDRYCRDGRKVSTTISSPLNDRRSRDGRKNVTKAGKGGKRRHDGTRHHDYFGEYMELARCWTGEEDVWEDVWEEDVIGTYHTSLESCRRLSSTKTKLGKTVNELCQLNLSSQCRAGRECRRIHV
jgi:hypothetical protein